MQETLIPRVDRVLQNLLQHLRQAVFAEALVGELKTEMLDELFWLHRVDGGIPIRRVQRCVANPIRCMLRLFLHDQEFVVA